MFKTYGEVLDVVAHSNLRMRGQAFVSFASKDSASRALRDVQRFPLYSKPMVSLVVNIDINAEPNGCLANIVREDTIGCSGEKVRCGQL